MSRFAHLLNNSNRPGYGAKRNLVLHQLSDEFEQHHRVTLVLRKRLAESFGGAEPRGLEVFSPGESDTPMIFDVWPISTQPNDFRQEVPPALLLGINRLVEHGLDRNVERLAASNQGEVERLALGLLHALDHLCQ